MPTNRAYYSATIEDFLQDNENAILGNLAQRSEFDILQSQRDAWLEQISILKGVLTDRNGSVYFEYSIPRMGRRVDVVLLLGAVVFVLEFKIGETEFTSSALDQVCDYALDLKNFHETSRCCLIAPILVATKAIAVGPTVQFTPQNDLLLFPVKCNAETLGVAIDMVLTVGGERKVESETWEQGRYCPTPSIVEAAIALYSHHSVSEISRNDATAINLGITSDTVSEIIQISKAKSQKSICFVTGVPGAGKTLVGLNIATQHMDAASDLHSVFLSGNGPLVDILREALARNTVRSDKERGKKTRKGETLTKVKSFIQNIHHFRDECLADATRPPIEHVAIFDEAQRAWNLQQTAKFMARKKNRPNFSMSEPEFLIACLDRHTDWAVIVCLVGGGQEINTGEAGISEWILALNRSFQYWHVYVSSKLTDTEYGAGSVLDDVSQRINVTYLDQLHLAVSMRSFRSESVSMLVKQLLDRNADDASNMWLNVKDKYPIVITRDFSKAKQWLRSQARGSERYGMVVSSNAQRLKPHAIDVNSAVSPVHWFLDGKSDVRSSYYLEEVATEFDVQGLELDWVCVGWDADFRYSKNGWQHWRFTGDRWNRIKQQDRQNYLKNAYRVLLTRARQGMVIVVPAGDAQDLTRSSEFYDPTFNFLKAIGFATI